MNKLLYALPLLLLLGKKKGVTPNPSRPVNPPPNPQRDPRRHPAPKPPPVEKTDPMALDTLRAVLREALQSPRFDQQNKGHVQDALSSLSEEKLDEKDAILALRQLDEGQRKAFAEAKGRSFYTLGGSTSKPAAVGCWVYMHLFGKDLSSLTKAQGMMKIPQTGELDQATVAAVRQLTGYEIWSLALLNLALAEEQEATPPKTPHRSRLPARPEKTSPPPSAAETAPAPAPAPSPVPQRPAPTPRSTTAPGEFEEQQATPKRPSTKPSEDWSPAWARPADPVQPEYTLGEQEVGLDQIVCLKEKEYGALMAELIFRAVLNDDGSIREYMAQVIVPPTDAPWMEGQLITFPPSAIDHVEEGSD